jgi:hypothetical protein
MENPEQTEGPQDTGSHETGGGSGSRDPLPPTHSHSSHRDYIADRTGDLLREAVNVAREFPRAETGFVDDPRTGTRALFVLRHGDAVPLPASVFDEYLDRPVRRQGVAYLSRVESFIRHVNRFSDEDSAVFANDSNVQPSLTAVLDYHEAVNIEGTDATDGADESATDPQPRFGRHRAVFQFPLSDEWKGWTGKDGEPMDMASFARFLEDRIVDVEAVDDPAQLGEALRRFITTVPNGKNIASPSRLMALATGLKVHEASVVSEVRNLSSGEAQITFDAQHTDAAGAPLDLPGLFIINLPVFKGSNVVYRLAARLRYRKQSTGIVFWYDLWRADLVFTDAFNEVCDRVERETGLPLFYGSPE